MMSFITRSALFAALASTSVSPTYAVDFVKEIQPLIESSCLSCHVGEDADGELRLDSRQAMLAGGSSGPALVPSQPEKSPLYTLTVLPADDAEIMPPEGSGGPLGKELTEKLRRWIAEGAIWPEGVTLKLREKNRYGLESPDDIELVKRIHALIIQRSGAASPPKISDYSQRIPQTGVAYHMVAIAGGEFLMGSPSQEPERESIEGPRARVSVEPFWMGKYEVTWDEYEPFMVTQVDRSKDGARTDYDPARHGVVDAVTQPTAPYMEMSFGMGQSGYPAISMTQHAANKYCQWLSAQTGHFYRLPTEAEWEYACRARTTTAYSFGDDPAQLDDYAWYYDNSNEKYQKVGLKKPNAWGLYDMHGNVSEWTADQFTKVYFSRLGQQATSPFVAPKTLYPRSVRGGNWNDDPAQLRSAYRRGSDPVWKQQDPQLPKSIWYHTDARWLGFRLVRPVKVPNPPEMYSYWNSATNKH